LTFAIFLKDPLKLTVQANEVNVYENAVRCQSQLNILYLVK
jgi:hypothetical protein